jgi:hypothetical protein
VFVFPLFEARTLADACIVWYVFGLRAFIQSLAAVELSVAHGIFRWRTRIWRWTRNVEARQGDVTEVAATVRWYGNSLRIVMNGKTYSLGALLDDDVETVARELRRALPEARSAGPPK